MASSSFFFPTVLCFVLPVLVISSSIAVSIVERTLVTGAATSTDGDDSHHHHLRHGTATDCILNEFAKLVHSTRDNITEDGTIALPKSHDYNETIEIHNRLLSGLLPLVVVMPKKEMDIVAAMKTSRACSVPFSVLSGGHSAAGYSLAKEGLTVNMRALINTTFDFLPSLSSEGNTSSQQAIMRVTSGTRFHLVYQSLLDFHNGSYVVTGGGCDRVAIGGFVQGGGWSFLSRMYGLAIDNLLSVNMVLANGTFLQGVSNNFHPDLFWALRGGGGGNFGVATEFTLKLHQPEPKSTVGCLCWEENDPKIASMMDLWIKNFKSMPKWLNLDPVWLPKGDHKINTRHFCWQIFCLNVPSMCEPWLKPLRDFLPTYSTLKVQPYLPWQAGLGNATSAGNDGFLYIKSFVFKAEHFTMDTVAILRDAIRVSPSPHNLVLFHVGGGAVSEVPSNATAFPFRDLMVVLQLKALWFFDFQEAENMAWINLVADAFPAANVTGAYVNYIDPRLKDWQKMYYGPASNYQRLVDIKKAVDPKNFFRFNQSIGAK